MSGHTNGEDIPVGLYLFKRLQQLGVSGVHGVPGDFNLALLDLLPDAGLNWVGNCNELNAGYAADGYARVKGVSALVTTFGVGELSSLAAVAGAYSEHVPVVHIVGVPNTHAQKSGLMLHHTLGNADFNVFRNMYKNVSCATLNLNDPRDAPEEIDAILKACWIKSRPVYIALPTDIAFDKIPSKRLQTPLDLSIPTNNQDTEKFVVEQILDLIKESPRTVILADACSIRHRVLDELQEMVRKTGFPTFVTPMGKSAIDEDIPNFGGVYVGDASRDDVKQQIQNASLILYVGGMQSDFNTAGFTFHVAPSNTVEFHSDHMKIKYAEFPGCGMKYVMQRLNFQLDSFKLPTPEKAPDLTNTIPPSIAEKSTSEITHEWFWPTVGKWFQPNDMIITETGTANFGILESKFPKNAMAISQVLWGSIGYSVGATQGAALALKEIGEKRRVVLFVGDGSLQLTVQEISTMVRNGLKPIIFVINNKGYAIERIIHGLEASYNDIQEWDIEKLLPLFGANKDKYSFTRVRSRDECDQLLADEQFAKAEKLQLVELFMPKLDIPRALKSTAAATAKLNARLRGE